MAIVGRREGEEGDKTSLQHALLSETMNIPLEKVLANNSEEGTIPQSEQGALFAALPPYSLQHREGECLHTVK